MVEPSAPAAAHSIGEYLRGYADEDRLRGFRSSCGFVTATWGLICPRCGQRDLVEFDLDRRGRIVACSVQHVPSDEFLNDAPYAYVVVELDGGGRVTGWVATARTDDALAIGDPVHFVSSYKSGVQFEAMPKAETTE
ncbi:MAG: OB-fold domain-containing protein [Thermoplasmata archaeon]|nr:OB-fold domain-containing protein [Thermoplasmata archaeon]